MARTIRKSGMKATREIPLSEIKDDLSRYLREAVQNDPSFLRRIEQARESLLAGRGVKLEDIDLE